MPDTFSVLVPSAIEPSSNVTAPVGVAAPLVVTAAVKATLEPAVAGLGQPVSVVVVTCWTVSLSTAEVLAAFLASPPYDAVIECCPSAKLEVAKIATPEVFNVPVPRVVVVPFLKVTVPVGDVEPDGVTVAVKVTNEPKIAGFGLAVRLVVVEDGGPTVLQLAKKLATSIEPSPVTSSYPVPTK